MQIAGATCGACGSRITADADGFGCAPCRATYNRSCLVPVGRCRTCQADLELAAEDAEVQAQVQQRDEHARGRLQMLLVIAFVLFLPTLQLFFTTVALLFTPETTTLSRGDGLHVLCLFLFHVALAAGLYYGSPTSTRYLRGLLGLECVLQALGVWRDAASGYLPFAVVRAMGVVAIATAFLLLAHSKSVAAFVRSD